MLVTKLVCPETPYMAMIVYDSGRSRVLRPRRRLAHRSSEAALRALDALRPRAPARGFCWPVASGLTRADVLAAVRAGKVPQCVITIAL